MYKSNQFPRQQDKDKTALPTNEKAAFIYQQIISRKNKENSLYNYIMKKNDR